MAVRRRHETRSHDTVLLSHKLSEYHSGYRGFTCQVLKDPPLTHNLDDFLFDNEMLSQAILPGFRISELSCALKIFSGSLIEISVAADAAIAVCSTMTPTAIGEA